MAVGPIEKVSKVCAGGTVWGFGFPGKAWSGSGWKKADPSMCGSPATRSRFVEPNAARNGRRSSCSKVSRPRSADLI